MITLSGWMDRLKGRVLNPQSYVLFSMVVLTMAFGALGSEVVAENPIVKSQPQTWWMEALMSVLALICTTFLVPFLNARQKAAEAEALRLQGQTDLGVMEQRRLLSERLKSFLLRVAANRVEKDFLVIARKVADGSLRDKDEIKAILRSMGRDVRAEAIEYFGNQGIDLVKVVGDRALDELITWAANKVSPFPGKETAVAFLTDNASNKLIEFGVNYFRTRTVADEVPAPATPAN